jgi:tetratricopeptide (TPR) repeat protein
MTDMSDTTSQEIKLFYCYAREDKDLRYQLAKSLSGLKRYYHMTDWYDRQILAGQDWEQVIAERLDSADIIFLLISPDFIASDYCYGIEMQRALERGKEGSCLVLPILLRPTHWEGEPFGKLQLLPTNAKPITQWPDRDNAFLDVVKEVSRTIKDLVASHKTKQGWLDEGKLSRDLKHDEEALAAIEEAIRLDPSRATLHLMKGVTLNALKRYREALPCFEQAIHLDPNLVSAYISKDDTLQQLGITIEAYEQLESNLLQAYQELGLSKDEEKRLTEQRQEFEQRLQTERKKSEQLTEQLDGTKQDLAIERRRSARLEKDLETEQRKSKRLTEQLSAARKTEGYTASADPSKSLYTNPDYSDLFERLRGESGQSNQNQLKKANQDQANSRRDTPKNRQ